MGQQRALVCRVDRHEHGPEIIDREEYPQVLAAVGQPHQHMVALANAQTLQSDRGLDHQRAEVAISPLFGVVGELDEDLVGAFAVPALHQRSRHDPVAGRNARIGRFVAGGGRRRFEGHVHRRGLLCHCLCPLCLPDAHTAVPAPTAAAPSCSRACCCSTKRWILPVLVLGNSSTKRRCLGTL